VIVPALAAGLVAVPAVRVGARWVDLESAKMAQTWLYCKAIVLHLVNQELVSVQFRNGTGELIIPPDCRDSSLTRTKRRFWQHLFDEGFNDCHNRGRDKRPRSLPSL
jgi:hypothetical protein